MSLRNSALKLIIALLFFLLSNSSFAHISEGTNTLMRLSKSKISIIYTVPTDNIKELALDTDEAIADVIQHGFQFKNNQEACPVKLLGKKQMTSVGSTQFILDVSCKNSIKTLEIDYVLFLDKFDQHQNKTKISIGSRSQNFIYNKFKTKHLIQLDVLAKQWSKLKKIHQRKRTE